VHKDTVATHAALLVHLYGSADAPEIKVVDVFVNQLAAAIGAFDGANCLPRPLLHQFLMVPIIASAAPRANEPDERNVRHEHEMKPQIFACDTDNLH
jgi:hypothetical protein